MKSLQVDETWCFYVRENGLPNGDIGHKCNIESDTIWGPISFKDPYYVYQVFDVIGSASSSTPFKATSIRLLKTNCPNCHKTISDKLLMMVKMLI